MRKIKTLVPRKTLENLYKTLIRPILEYGCVIFDGMTENLSNRLENIQRQAGLVCTGAFRNTSTHALLHETGWDTLANRRKYYKLILMYKILNNKTPAYLKDLIPMRTGERTGYNLRNPNRITLVRCNKTGFLRSFIPSSVREWNALSNDLKGIAQLSTFKTALKRNMLTSPNKLYSLGYGIESIHHTRMRIGLSALQKHLFTYHIVDDPYCPFCQMAPEDELHYFMCCPYFADPRTKLLMSLIEIVPLATLQQLDDKDIAKLMLVGSNQLTLSTNRKLFTSVCEFIHDSDRFTNTTW